MELAKLSVELHLLMLYSDVTTLILWSWPSKLLNFTTLHDDSYYVSYHDSYDVFLYYVVLSFSPLICAVLYSAGFPYDLLLAFHTRSDHYCLWELAVLFSIDYYRLCELVVL